MQRQILAVGMEAGAAKLWAIGGWRMAEPSKTLGSVRFGRFELLVETGELLKDGIRLKLSGQAIHVLLLLARNSGKLVTREELQQKLWPGASFGDPEHGLNAAVNRLRETLGDSATEPKYVETIPGRGYCFIAQFEPQAITPKPEPPKPPWWKRKTTIAVTASIAIAGVLYPWIGPPIERLRRLSELQRLKVVPLTSLPGVVTSPTFSPDGSQIAFVWWRGNPSGYGQLYAKVLGNDNPLLLTRWPVGVNALSAAWSPDGRHIAACRASGTADDGIYLISPLGGTERKIGSNCGSFFLGGAFSWSPDGKQLAFLTYSAAGDTFALSVLSLDTLETAPVKTNCAKVMLPAFSPRGDYLAWACADKARMPIYLERLSDGRITELLRSAEGVGGIAWSSDGRRMVFTGGSPVGDLWEVALSGPNRPMKLPFGHDAKDLAVSFTGHRLAFEQVHANTNIWRLDLSQPPGHAEKAVTSSREQTAPEYSPDGTKIVFVSDRSGNREIWVSDSDGSSAMQLSSLGIRSTGTPRWSPDGKLIAFDSWAAGEANIYLVDPHGGVPHKLDVNVRGNNQPSWSHEGKWIYFVNGYDSGNPTIWKVPSTGGHAVQLANNLGVMPFESPDGRYVYFSREGRLWQVATAGAGEQQVQGMPPIASDDAWSPFGSGIYFAAELNGKREIDFFDLKTRSVRTIHVLDGHPPEWMGGLPVSPDGRWLLFAQLDSLSSDLMMIENWR